MSVGINLKEEGYKYDESFSYNHPIPPYDNVPNFGENGGIIGARRKLTDKAQPFISSECGWKNGSMNYLQVGDIKPQPSVTITTTTPNLIDEPVCLYEILVPTVSNEGKPYKTRYHRVWDNFVYELVGGITILRPAKGKWIDKSVIEGDKFLKVLYEERVIPVRIACTRSQLEKIIDYTIKYYNQIAVMAYKISEEVIVKYRD